jgi:hypothetical protein
MAQPLYKGARLAAAVAAVAAAAAAVAAAVNFTSSPVPTSAQQICTYMSSSAKRTAATVSFKACFKCI